LTPYRCGGSAGKKKRGGRSPTREGGRTHKHFGLNCGGPARKKGEACERKGNPAETGEYCAEKRKGGLT